MSKSLYLKIEFRDGDEPHEEALERLTKAIANELEFQRPLKPGGYEKRGWGMTNHDGSSHNLIVKVTRYSLPLRRRHGSDIIVDGIGAVSVHLPGDKVKGRFVLRGRVSQGIKATLGRMVELRVDINDANFIINQLADQVLKHSKTGTHSGEERA